MNTGHDEVLGEGHQRVPALLGVGAGADHEGGRLGVVEPRGELLDRLGGRGAGVQQALGADDLVGLGRRRVPVVHRHDDERGAARGRGGVVGAHERARDVLRAHGLVDRDRVLARQAVQAAGEEGLLGEVAAVLLADHDHQWRAIDARGGQRGDGVAEPGGGVQQGEGRRAAPERVAGGHPDDRALVQAQHELEVVGQAGQEGDLGRAGVGEDRRQPQRAQDVEGGLAHRRRGGSPVACHRRLARGPRGLACHRPAL